MKDIIVLCQYQTLSKQNVDVCQYVGTGHFETIAEKIRQKMNIIYVDYTNKIFYIKK